MPRSKQYRAFVFTLNNYTQLEVEGLWPREGLRYLVYGKELGSEKQTPHLQGYIYVTAKSTIARIKKMIPALQRAHIEPRRGSHEEARSYCIKDGEVSEFGTPPKSIGQGCTMSSELNTAILSPLIEFRTLIENEVISPYSVPTLYKARNILLNEVEPLTRNSVCGVWIYGPPGVGKSHVAHEMYPNAFIKQQNKWWDGYEGHETVLLDDLDTNVLGHYLKIWMDKWPCRGEIKGGTVPLRHKRFIITSNYTPEMLWSEDLMLSQAIKRRVTMWKISRRR